MLVEDRAAKASARPLLEATGAKAVWTEAGFRVGGTREGSVLWLQGELATRNPSWIPPAPCAASAPATLMATSGSTSVPRFVVVSHENLISNTEAIVRSQHQLGGDERGMLILPLSYCFGASLLHTHLYQGGGVVFDRRFMFPDKVLQAIAQYGCTTFGGVPTAYHALLRRSNIRRIEMPSLRRFLQAGGALAAQEVREMRESFPRAKFYVMYGQTEATARISCMEPESAGRRNRGSMWADLWIT